MKTYTVFQDLRQLGGADALAGQAPDTGVDTAPEAAISVLIFATHRC